MPSNGKISLAVSIGGCVVPEYFKDGVHYVECDLFTPSSYDHEVRELAYGEVEVQKWPVTPYTVEVRLYPNEERSYIQLSIDGTRLGTKILRGGQSCTFQGFDDAEGTKEFLFALPRFAADENDRISANRLSDIGIIKVEQYSVTYAGHYASSKSRGVDTAFDQANKKDARNITGGAYTLSTTKKGRVIKMHDYKSPAVASNHYTRADYIGEVAVKYMMGYSLVEKGISLRPPPWRK